MYVVDEFVTDSECDAMLADTPPKMGRSVVGEVDERLAAELQVCEALVGGDADQR